MVYNGERKYYHDIKCLLQHKELAADTSMVMIMMMMMTKINTYINQRNLSI
jgi:hypothetical protein